MKLSIVIPTFNQGHYIGDCLTSIRRQTFRDFEVIIQDAESTDQTGAICLSFAREDSRFRYFREIDSGQSDAINRGLSRSSGEFWTWICSDDAYANDLALDHLVNLFEMVFQKDTRVVGVFGDAQYISEDGITLNPYPSQKRDLRRQDFKMVWPLSQPSLLLRRQMVLDVGGVDPSLHFGMDLDLFIRLLDGDRYFMYAPNLVAKIRVQPESKSIKLRHQTAVDALAIVKKHYGDTGSLMESTHGHEYFVAKRQAFRAALLRRLEGSMWTCKMVAFMRFIMFSAWKFRNKAIYYMNQGREENNFRALFYRVVWRCFYLFRKCLFVPVQGVRNKLTHVYELLRGHPGVK